MKHFTITRDKAAELLWISTRTIDRYIKSGKLWYKKVANKVFLAVEEIDSLKKEFEVLHQEVATELVNDGENNAIQSTAISQNNSSVAVKPSIDLAAIEDKIDKFSLIFVEKDKMIDEKNRVIIMLQKRIAELETKIQSMIALPDYTKEKQEALEEKRALEEKLEILRGRLKEEWVRTYVLMWFALVLLAITIFLFIKYNSVN